MSKYTPDYWRSLIAELAGDLPTDRLVAWEREESDGVPSALGSRYEVGIFQLNLEDGPAWGGTLDTLHGNFSASPTSQTLMRELTSDEEALQVTSGAAFIRWVLQRSQSRLAGAGLSWSDRDLWCYVKLYHALPRLWDNYLDDAARAGNASSWDDFKARTLSLTQDEAATINPFVAAHYYPFDRFFRNAERVGDAAGGAPGAPGKAELLLLAILAAAAVAFVRFFRFF